MKHAQSFLASVREPRPPSTSLLSRRSRASEVLCRVPAKILVARKLGRDHFFLSPIFGRPEYSPTRDTKHFAQTGTLATQAIHQQNDHQEDERFHNKMTATSTYIMITISL